MLKWINDDCLKRVAIILAGVAFLMFAIPLIAHNWCTPLDLQAYGTFVGGTAGPLAALAAFLLIYLTFQQQREQIQKHDIQFERQSFHSTFFNLLEYHKEKVGQTKFHSRNELLTLDDLKNQLESDFSLLTTEGYEADPEDNEYFIVIHSERSIEEFASSFFASYQKELPQIQNIFQSALAMFSHMHNVDESESAKYYDILVSQITDAEKFIYFYYFISVYYNLTTIEKQQTKKFLQQVNPALLVYPSHL